MADNWFYGVSAIKYSILRDIFRGINLQNRVPDLAVAIVFKKEMITWKKRSFSRWRFETKFSMFTYARVIDEIHENALFTINVY